MNSEITTYYDKLASDYDQSRFSNSYGKFIHYQESQVLNRYNIRADDQNNLDIACGTGRFLHYANHGIDVSAEMIKTAKQKFPTKNLIVGNADALPYVNDSFDNAISFHLFMHLDEDMFRSILDETHRVLKKGGKFIFDIPSKKRRNLTNYKARSWHGSNSMSTNELRQIIAPKWNLLGYQGTLFSPIHRIPEGARRFFRTIDLFLCNSMVKEYSSHLIFVIEKR